MAKALMIGLGGTGIKTLLHIKQQLMGRNPDGQIEDGIEFLGIDTDNNPPSIQGVYDPNATLNEESTISLNQGELVCQAGYLGTFVDNAENVQLDWFAKDWYLEHPNSQVLLNVTEGASMHRQVGRLALFKMLETGAENSNLYRILNEKLELVIENSIAKVLIFGSLAGGTGASMINDIPLMLQDIAYHNNNQAVIRAYGFFALPDAFEHTPNVSVDGEMRARALAALREMIRFNNRQIDLSMSYDAQGTIRVDVSNAPYNILFLFDKKGTPQAGTAIQNPLDADIAYGVCPTMASFAWVFADDNPNQQLSTHLANRVADIDTLSVEYNGYNPPLCCSFGSFSYVLPLGAIVEDWTCQFARDLLGVLVPVDDNGRILTNQKGGQRSNAGNVEVSPVMLDALRDFEPLVRDVVEIGDSEKAKANDKSTISNICTTKMMDRKVSQWQDRFRIPPDPEETDTQKEERVKEALIFEKMKEENTYYCRIKKILGKEVAVVDEGALVPLVDAGDYDDDAHQAAVKLINECASAYDREKNRWELTFSTRRKKILNAYKAWLKDFADETLNGDAQNAAYVDAAKSGKLGWLWDFVRELVARMHAIGYVLEEAEKAYELKKSEINSTYDVEALERKLKKNPSNKNQKEYLMYQQDLLEQNRLKFLCHQELKLVRSMREYTETLLKSLRDYLRMICDGEDFTLESSLSDQQATIAANRLHSQERIKRVREYINDPDWETSKYREYLHNDNPEDLPMNLVLQDVKWEVEETTQQGRQARDDQQTLNVELHIEGFEEQAQGDLRFNVLHPLDPAELISDEEKINLLSSNLNRLAARCRNVFLGVWHRISVMDYLYDEWNGESPHSRQDFAERMASKIDVVLEGARNNVNEKVFYLYPVTNNQNYINWAEDIYEQLRNGMGTAQNNYADINHHDPTTFTVMKMVDYVKIDHLTLWQHAETPYLERNAVLIDPPQPSRPLLHVFKAEQLACRYDRMMDNGQTELLDSKIVALFEQKDKLALFINALMWGFITKYNVPDQQGNQGGVIFNVHIKPFEGETHKFRELVKDDYREFLNDPQKYQGGLEPSLLQAAETFCLKKTAYNTQPANSKLKTMEEFVDRLEEEIKKAIQDEMSATLKKWEDEEPEKDIEKHIFGMPTSNSRQDLLKKYVLLNKYRQWCHVSGENSKLQQIFNIFDNAREQNDNHNQLRNFAESEEQFVTDLLDDYIYTKWMRFDADLFRQI